MALWIYHRLGLTVWASDADVETALREWITPRLKPGVHLTKKLTREVLKHHHDARQLCEEWRM